MPYDIKKMRDSLETSGNELDELVEKHCEIKDTLPNNNFKVASLIDMVDNLHTFMEIFMEKSEETLSEQKLKELKEINKTLCKILENGDIDKEINDVLKSLPEAVRGKAKLLTTLIKNNYDASVIECKRLLSSLVNSPKLSA